MSQARRVQNITNGFWYRPSQLAKAFDACAVGWVEEGVTVRNLTLAEAIEARKAQAELAERLPRAEFKHLVYKPAKGREQQHYDGLDLIADAREFVMGAVKAKLSGASA